MATRVKAQAMRREAPLAASGLRDFWRLCKPNVMQLVIFTSAVAMFVAPVLVLLSFVLGPGPMPLVFNGFEIAAIFLGVLVAYQVTNEGESTWFEGVQLLALYAILGLTFYFV